MELVTSKLIVRCLSIDPSDILTRTRVILEVNVTQSSKVYLLCLSSGLSMGTTRLKIDAYAIRNCLVVDLLFLLDVDITSHR